MRVGLALWLFSLGFAHAAAQPRPPTYVDSALTPGGKVVVLGTGEDVRITMTSGSRTKTIVVFDTTALAFGASATLILAVPPKRHAGARGYASVSYDLLRFEYIRTDGGDTLRFAITGPDPVDLQTDWSNAGHIITVIGSAGAGARMRAAQEGARKPQIETRVTVQASPVSPSPTSESDRVYFEFQTEKQAQPKPDNPGPVYPATLRSANVEGEVLAQFVVDTLGHPDVQTFKVLKSTHDLFTQAVKDVLPRLQFTPAELGGRKVKQLVQRPFQFNLTPRSPAQGR